MELGDALRLLGLILALPGIFSVRHRGGMAIPRGDVWERCEEMGDRGLHGDTLSLVPNAGRLNREMALYLAVPPGMLLLAAGLWIDGDPALLMVVIALLTAPLVIAEVNKSRKRKAAPTVLSIDADTIICHRTGTSIAVSKLVRVTRERPQLSRVQSLYFLAPGASITLELARVQLPGRPRTTHDDVITAVVDALPKRTVSSAS
ncbi:MAG: hypothetical protein ACFCVC_05475 [Acidimicrobiia bacterium]